MNNFEKIKNMTLDEMADFLTDSSACDVCACDMEEDECLAVGWVKSDTVEHTIKKRGY